MDECLMTSHPSYLDRDHGEGYFEIDDYELFYRRFGHGDTVVLGLHGGPGMPHDYLAPLSQHGSDDVSVYLYDQFDVGRSSTPAPGDFDRYSVEHYREEVEAVRQKIDPDTFIVYGQSWGGMLAQEYVLKYQEHVDGLILANTLADVASAYKSMRGVLDGLPEEARETIEAYEAKRAFDAPEYEDALMKAYKKHLCRLDEYPQPVRYTLENVSMDVYGLMWGPNEYILLEGARLRGWDVRDRLGEIEVPTHVLTGSYDEIKPEIAEGIASRIPSASLTEFKESSHMPFWEEPDYHYEIVEEFITDIS